MADEAPREVYEAVARNRFYRWGYYETLRTETEEAKFIEEQVSDPNLQADVDIVWRLTHGEGS